MTLVVREVRYFYTHNYLPANCQPHIYVDQTYSKLFHYHHNV